MKKVLVGGAFDLIHYAHILTLWEARKYGDRLIVNVNSDARIRVKKGEARPIIPEAERIEMVRAIRWVDEVVCLTGDSEYPVLKLLDIVKPDVLVLNEVECEDFTKEKEACAVRGIELVRIKRIISPSGLDTSGIIRKIKAL